MQALDKIHLKNVEAFSRLGVFDIERAKGQTISIDVDLELDLKKACASDKIEDTVDYSKVSSIIQTTAKAKEYFLIEHLAEEVAKNILLCSELIRAITIKVHKPIIVTEGFSGDVSITIYRSKT